MYIMYIYVECVCLLVVAHLNLMCLLLQYRVARLFTEKTATVISRGFQLKHIPSGEVGTVPAVCFCTPNSSVEGATELKFVSFCSS